MLCPKGQIRRVAYQRKKTGTNVPSTCIKDRGTLGRGKKSLPLFDKKISLRKEFDYSTTLPERERKRSLKKASEKYGSLPVLKHLVLARNYQAKENVGIKQKMKKDIIYLSRLHKTENDLKILKVNKKLI